MVRAPRAARPPSTAINGGIHKHSFSHRLFAHLLFLWVISTALSSISLQLPRQGHVLCPMLHSFSATQHTTSKGCMPRSVSQEPAGCRGRASLQPVLPSAACVPISDSQSGRRSGQWSPKLLGIPEGLFLKTWGLTLNLLNQKLRTMRSELSKNFP